VLGVIGVVAVLTGTLGWQGFGTASLVLGGVLTMNSLSMLQAKRYFEELYFQASRSQARYTDDPPCPGP
jgi:hypothetical protein